LENQTFSIGDRILFALDQGQVPFGVHGTVIGFDGPQLEILCDVRILIGTNLKGRCPDGFGITCSSSGILNLSDIQPPYSAKAPRNQKPRNPVVKTIKDNAPSPSSNWKSEKQSPQVRQKLSKSIETPPPIRPAQEQEQTVFQPIEEVEGFLKQVLHIDSGDKMAPQQDQVVSQNLLDVLHGKETKQAQKQKANRDNKK
jgi:hypothetical protein